MIDMKRTFLALLLVIGLIGCGSGETSRPNPTPTPTPDPTPIPDEPFALPVETGSLASIVQDMIFVQKNTEAYAVPTETERSVFKEAFDHLLKKKLKEAKEDFDSLDLDLVDFHDVGGDAFYLVRENASGILRGWGLFAVDPNSSRSLTIEAPHPVFDTGTENEAAQVFLALDARALLIAGAHRCADALEASGCVGPVNQCGTTTPRVSDAAHSTVQVFQAAHEALIDSDPLLTAVALHGFSQGSGAPHAYVSDGTKGLEGADSLSNDFTGRLKDLTGLSSAAQSCNDGGPGAASDLCGTLDVQGRYANGSADACTLAPSATADRFLHIEQSMDLRTEGGALSPEAVIQTLQAMFP